MDSFRRVDSTASKKIRSIKVVQETDCDPDLSFLGVYTDKAEPWNIERRSGQYVAELDEDYEIPERGREFRFFKPCAGEEPEGTEDYKKYGLQDFKRMEDYERNRWWMEGVYAQAEIVILGVIQRLRSGGLYGIESDSDEAYFKEIADEQLAELKDILEQLGFTKEEINGVEIG
jgi:hypothetical protein